MNKLTLADLDLYGKRVLVRLDFNVPLLESPPVPPGEGTTHKVADDTRIRAALPTLGTITDSGGKAVLLSHLGRPKGEPNPMLSLSPVASHLSSLLGAPVRFCSETTGVLVYKTIRSMPNGSILLLENTRFLPGETRNDPILATELAELGDLFVNDAFGTSHRAHASNVGVARLMPRAAAGYLLEHELKQMQGALDARASPMIALLGGAKVSDKIGVITNLINIVDQILIGGAMSYTFLKAKGFNTGNSLVEDDRLDDALDMIAAAKGNIILPIDHITSTGLDAPDDSQVTQMDIPEGLMGLDIGPATTQLYADIIRKAKTVIWNGPMGVFENPAFATGTRTMASALVDATNTGAVTIVGGGASVAAITQAGLETKVSHISTGGGAMLQVLEGKSLPGVTVLTDKA